MKCLILILMLIFSYSCSKIDNINNSKIETIYKENKDTYPQIISYHFNSINFPIPQGNLLSYDFTNKEYPILEIDNIEEKTQKIKFLFNKSINIDSFEKSIVISSKDKKFYYNYKDFIFDWFDDNKSVIITLKNKLNIDNSYFIKFTDSFESISNKKSILGSYIKFSNTFSNDFFAFKLKKMNKNIIKGTIYDINHNPIENSLVKLSYDSVDSYITTKKDGKYEFKNISPKSLVTIVVSKYGWTEKKRNFVSYNNYQEINFENEYALQDQPEIIKLYINDLIASPSGFYKEGNLSLKSYINSFNSSDFKIKLVFSEYINKNSFEKSFYLKSKTDIIDYNNLYFEWSEDFSSVSIKLKNNFIFEKNEIKKDYLLDFYYPFKDKNGNESISGKYIKYSDYYKCSSNIFTIIK